MTDGPERPIELWCPSCHTTVGDAAVCPACGFPGQQTLEAARLRVVVARMAEIGAEHAALASENDTLVEERHRLFTTLRGAPTVDPQPFSTPAGAEWRPERVRDVLLWLGALLLIVAAITFAAVAWARVGAAGRAGILLGVTVGAGALTAFVRPRLRPTAEALAAITIALALVDWGVARRTGLRGDLSDATWWTIGLTLVALGCAALADRLDLAAVRLGTVTLLPAAAVAGVVAVDPSDSLAVVALGVITGAVVAGRARARGRWADVRGWLTFVAVAGEIVVGAAALALAVDRWAHVGHGGAALAVLSTACAPLTYLVVGDGEDHADPAMASGVVTLATLGAGAVLLSGSLSNRWVLAAIAAGALVVGVVARVLPVRPRLGVAAAAAAALVPPTVAVAPNVAAAWLHPVAWLGAPWTGSLADPVGQRVAHGLPADIHGLAPTLVTLTCLALFLLVVPTDAGTRVLRFTGAGIVAAVAGTIALAASEPSIGTALALHLAATIVLVVGAIAADRRASATTLPLLAVAIVGALPAVGFAAVSPTASLVTLMVTFGLGSVAAVSFRTPALRVAAAVGAGAALVGGTGVVMGDRGTSVGVAGVVLVTVGAAILVAARLAPWRDATRPIGAALEAVGVAGAAIGFAVAGDRPSWRLFGFAIATGALLLAARRADERATGYACAALVAGGLGGVAGWATGRIPSEWITVPAGAAAIAIGLAPRFPVRPSWLRLGPGLLLAFVTSVGIAVDRGSVLRALVVGAAALLVLALGARGRLGAPIVVGSVALLVLAIDGVVPYAASVPRWVLIGSAGALALWAGATADRRLDQMRRWRSAIDRLV